jgi:hypothetical protein
MLRRILSILGLACIGVALTGFFLPHSLMRVAPQAESPYPLTFDEGDEGQPLPSPTSALTPTPTPTPNSTPTPTATSTIATPTPHPSPSATPLPTPSPLHVPTPLPTPLPTPSATPIRREEYEKSKAQYERIARAHGDEIGRGEADGWLWLKVRSALSSDESMRVARIRVAVSNSVVTLTGSVPNAGLKERAESLVRRAVNGEAQVFSKLTVEAWNPKIERLMPPASTAPTRPGDNNEATPKSNDASSVAYVKTQSVISESSKLEIEYPQELKKTDTGVVRVTIIREPNVAASPTTDIPGNTVTQIAPEHCNTPHPGLRNAYGAQYEATALAKLDSSSFDVRASTTDPQTLDPSRVTWQWSITPKGVGSQAVNLSVTVQWKRRGTSQTKPSCKILDRSLSIHVTDSLLSDSNILKAQTILGLVGVFLQLPIFVGRKKEKKE